MGCTVRELGERMDSAELSEWLAFERIEPMAEPWLIGAQQCAITFNGLAAMAGSKKRVTYEDFLPVAPRKRAKRQSTAQMKAIARAFAGGARPDGKA